MTTQQKIRLNMYMAVRNYVNHNESIVKKIVKFLSGFIGLQKAIDEIQAVSKIQGLSRKGYTAEKNDLKKKVINLTLKNASKLAILARQNNNNVLMGEVKFRETDLTRLTEATLVDKARIIWERVDSNMQNLSEQDVTAETQQQFLQFINAFNTAISTPRTGVSERKQATQSLQALFESADASIEIMDLAAASVKDEYPDFYNGYKSNRVLVEIRSGSVLIKGIAREFLSGKPVSRAVFTFSSDSPSGNGNGKVIKKTTDKGNFLLKNLFPGTYNVLVSKRGYKDKNVNVIINEGEKVELKVELEKS